jgi:rod shape determining protein RodA
MFAIDRRYIRYFDWLSLLLMMLLSSISLFFVFSATYSPDQPYSLFFKKQLFGMASGLLIYIIMCAIDHRSLERWGYLLYFATIGLLVFTLLKGSIGLGAQRWISFGFFKFQPSELAKLFFPPFFSYRLSGFANKELSLRAFLPIIAITAVSALLIIKQPDLGTALVIVFAATCLLWLIGIKSKYFVFALVFMLITAPVTWHCLKPYQKQRIVVFFGGGSSNKERYQIEQSQIAIGSGGLFGKGFLQGTQNRLNFLPESRTDFIFSVICEETGFLGAFTLLLLYFLLFTRLFWVAGTIGNPFMQLLALGLMLPSVVSMLINVCMVLGMLPIVGIPLPLITYGITHLWITFASLGWFNGIAMRRFIYG